MRLVSDSEQRTIEIGRVIGVHASPCDAIFLSGDLGAGKTRVAKGVAEGLGVLDDITSPTFNIVYEYRSGRLPFFHFDLYRLDTSSQLEDIAYYEILEEGGVSVVEWGDKFGEAKPADRLEMDFRLRVDGVREIGVTAFGDSSRSLLESLRRFES